MGIFHFLNVGNGDCSIIQHATNHVTVVDVCKARRLAPKTPLGLLGLGNALTNPPLQPGLYGLGGHSARSLAEIVSNGLLGQPQAHSARSFADIAEALGANTEYHQKYNATNPIEYMLSHGITDVFRFILTHPDMDHMDGIKDFFEEFQPTNFWDLENTCIKDGWGAGGSFRKEDWDFYCSLRDGRNTSSKRMVLYSGNRGKFFNKNGDESAGGDGLHILSPTPHLVKSANDCNEYNDASYVIMYCSAAGKILMAGDAHDSTWEHILKNHADFVKDVDVLIAPHHGRHSDACFDYLDVVNPQLTLFGNAPSEHLAYGAWNSRDLTYITNNQAGNVIIDTDGTEMQVYITSSNYAGRKYPNSPYSQKHKGYHIGYIPARLPA